MLLFFVLFTLLVRPRHPASVAVGGALLGAIAFEVLKWLSSFLIGLTKDQPAFQAFGIALILLVWINYFSRVVVYAAAWAFTTVPRGVPAVEPVARRGCGRARPARRARAPYDARGAAQRVGRLRRRADARPRRAAASPQARLTLFGQ